MKKQAIQLSDHFTFRKLFRFTLSPILMLIFTSIYGVVDGLCVSNFAGLNAYAGVNLIYPATMIVGGIGFMFGAGGSALASKKLGEGDQKGANQVFSNMIYCAIITGLILSLVGFFCVEPIVNGLASLSKDSNPEMVSEATLYGRIFMLGQLGFILQMVFQDFFIVNETPTKGFLFTLGGGITNIIGDLLFVGAFKWGVTGAAIATIMGFVVAGVGPIIYFQLNKNTKIRLIKCRLDWKAIFQSLLNGSSEFVSNIALSVCGIIFNALLLKYLGSQGVIAYGTINYVLLLFLAIYIGYSIGTAPIVGFNYGAQNHEELHNVTKKSLIIIACTGLVMLGLGEGLAYPIAWIFSRNDADVINLTVHAMRIYSIAFAFCGISMFLSSFFTGLNNGPLSALISLLRIGIFQIGIVFLFSFLFQGDGIWWSVPVAEALSAMFALTLLFMNKNKYKY